MNIRSRRIRNVQFELPGLAQLGSTRRWTRCVYCGDRASSRDHVPPKLLLKSPYPRNYRTVPACADCNGGYSKDEEYFRVVLGLSGFSEHLQNENDEGGYIDRILRRSSQLDDRINSSMSVDADGRIFMIPEQARMKRVCRKLTCGLFALRYGAGRFLEDFVVENVQHSQADLKQSYIAAMHFQPGIRAKRWTVVQPDAFEFLFAKGWLVNDPFFWCFISVHGTIFAAVRCPAPPQGSSRVNLDQPPW